MDQVRLLDLIAGTLGVPVTEISEASDMTTVKKWDSLRHLMLMMELETNYGIELTDEEMTAATSIGRIRQILRQHGTA